MGSVAICALACFVAHNLTISTDITNAFVDLKGTFLLIESVLESEEKIILKNGQSGSSSAFPVKTQRVCILKDL